jgi:hypothetical protein
MTQTQIPPSGRLDGLVTVWYWPLAAVRASATPCVAAAVTHTPEAGLPSGL